LKKETPATSCPPPTSFFLLAEKKEATHHVGSSKNPSNLELLLSKNIQCGSLRSKIELKSASRARRKLREEEKQRRKTHDDPSELQLADTCRCKDYGDQITDAGGD